jgi:TolB-like protein
MYRVAIDLDLPNRNSIAVLPFDNMSADPEQDYFADGLAEDLITDLSKISELPVIARNSTFIYKRRPVSVAQVGRELGVRYVIEGSVRKIDHRVRITVQLIDALTSTHVWACRYDRDLTDIFALQDEITREIVGTLTIQLNQTPSVFGQRSNVIPSPLESLGAASGPSFSPEPRMEEQP